MSGLAGVSSEDLKLMEAYFGSSLTPQSLVATKNNKLELVLDVLEALWMTQAMKERHFDAWFASLKVTQENEV